MKKLGALALVLVVLAAPLGCYGPQKVTYKWQDISDEFYASNNPWIGGNIIAYFVFGFVNSLTWWVDGFVNAYYFWIDDAWPIGDGKSTPAVHKNPTKPGN